MRIKVGQPLSETESQVQQEVTIRNPHGLHARPIMRFVDLAGTFRSRLRVRNVTRNGELLDGKSAFEMMLLEATFGNVLRLEADGPDAQSMIAALVELIETTLAAEPADPSD